jgi:hypothetical protein
MFAVLYECEATILSLEFLQAQLRPSSVAATVSGWTAPAANPTAAPAAILMNGRQCHFRKYIHNT